MNLDEATRRQIEAANPRQSTWLSANAGSGKTRVLTDRVARLLLEGVSPQNILCLTYTKAAATNMQNQLFRRLGKWAMLNDEALVDELGRLGAQLPDDTGRLIHARTLFARAIETPGGLRIQTIHSFCASLLRRFPLESGVSPVFKEMEERAIKLLRQDIVEHIAQGPNAQTLKQVAQYYTGEDFDKLSQEIIKHAKTLGQPVSKDEIWKGLGLSAGYDWSDILSGVYLGDEHDLFAELLPILEASPKVSDRTLAKKLAKQRLGEPTLSDLKELFAIFLYAAKAKVPFGSKASNIPTKGTCLENPDIISRLHNLMGRIEAAHEPYSKLYSAEKTVALWDFAAVFLPAYEAEKTARGCLDFDDLIGRASNLLSNPAVAQWVLYRLDGGLDHILVDEAQDTSPQQWRVIELLAQEFSAGQGARADIERTIFVVGDVKQSIYSFQGADPKAFDQMKEHFSARLEEANQHLSERSLEHSFRSSFAVLKLVDSVFHETNGAGVGGPPLHLAFHGDLPGRVDLWPVVPKATEDEEKEWYDPTDKLAANNHQVVLAEKIAATIEDIQKSGSIPDNNGKFRRVRFDDFLILVQRRSDLFHEIIRACKSRNLPMAGADRLRIGAELAVKDLMALLAFLALPEDNLSLAAALRSPLFSITEDDLFNLAHDRQGPTLWATLSHRGDQFDKTIHVLSDLRNQAEFQNPYALLERILTRHHGRANLLARLGPEAEDGIDALLDQAVTYERSETPSLTGFLIWLDAEEVEIKRQSDNLGGRIRVMTTHGAKGLEAPIVILPDTADRPARNYNEITQIFDRMPVWLGPADTQPESVKQALTQTKIARNEEMMRLLYVALTRAEKWLIICASGNAKPDGDSWYRTVETGMKATGAQPITTPTGDGLRLEHGAWSDAEPDTTGTSAPDMPVLPEWARTRSSPPSDRRVTLSPSDMGGAKSVDGDTMADGGESAMARGQQIHLLLEHLPNHPSDQWQNIAEQVLDGQGDAGVLSEAQRLLKTPEFADIFGPASLAEVEVSAHLAGPNSPRIRGTIDRLVISDNRALIVDFKSNQLVPDMEQNVPVGILRQMAAYLAAITEIYPAHEIQLAILWTASGELMSLSHDIVRASLVGAPHLDAPLVDP